MFEIVARDVESTTTPPSLSNFDVSSRRRAGIPAAATTGAAPGRPACDRCTAIITHLAGARRPGLAVGDSSARFGRSATTSLRAGHRADLSRSPSPRAERDASTRVRCDRRPLLRRPLVPSRLGCRHSRPPPSARRRAGRDRSSWGASEARLRACRAFDLPCGAARASVTRAVRAGFNGAPTLSTC